MIYIVCHYKAKLSTNREFNVARFLLVQVGHILYKYLGYIRPIIEMLHHEHLHGSSLAILSLSLRLLSQFYSANKP
jgi:hypothetical protein